MKGHLVKLVVSLAIAAGLAVAASARAAPDTLPDGASMARLAAPLAQPVEKLIDGRDWTCAGAVCTAAHQDTADSQPMWMECSDAAAAFGAFTEYRTGPDTLEPAKLKRCNAQAKQG
jgi:hypothetical protein